MNPAIHKLLQACDDDGFEVPHNDWAAFPHKELAKSVARLQARIRAALDIDLRRDGNVQDASFLDDLFVSLPVEGRPNQFYYAFAVRFSNFGRLFTIYGLSAEVFATFPAEHVRRLIEGEGWTYVPPEALEERYDGVNDDLVKSGATWWIRYFDYL